MFGSRHWEKRLVKEKKKCLQNFLRLQLKPAFFGKSYFCFFSPNQTMIIKWSLWVGLGG